MIKWSNVAAFALVVLALALVLSHLPEIKAVLDSVGHIGPGHTLEEKTLGLGVLGVCLVALVAAVRIICNRERKDQ